VSDATAMARWICLFCPPEKARRGQQKEGAIGRRVRSHDEQDGARAGRTGGR
jgi:hypothetical protein